MPKPSSRSARAPRGADRSRLAPSIRKAHRRVQIALVAALVHGPALLALGAHALFSGSRPEPIRAVILFAGAIAIPLLARASYRGNSFAALLLFLTAPAPVLVAFLAGFDLALPLLALMFAPFYYMGARGAIGLRGRRGSKRR